MDTRTAVIDDVEVRTDWQLLTSFARRNWWVILGCVAVAIAAGLIYLALAKPGYRATAILLIQPQSAEGEEGAAAPATPELVRSQIEILRSARVLNSAVAKLGLEKDPAFIDEVPEGAPPEQRRAAAREELAERLTVENDGRSFIISLGALASDPRKAADIANTTAATYIDVERRQKVELIESTLASLGPRLAALRAETIEAERQAELFRIRAGLVPLSSVPEDSESYAAATPASREIIEMSKEHATLAAQRARAQSQAQAQQNAIARGNGQSTSEVLSSSVVSDLRTREAALAQREAELLARYAADHPLVGPVRAELDQVRTALSREVARIHDSVRSQASASSMAFRSGDDFMSQLASERSRDLAASTELRQLQRDAQLKRDIYEEYATQMQHAAERAGLQLPDVLLISPASPPLRSARPNPAVLLAGLAFVGLILGLLLGLLRSTLADRRITVRETVAVTP